MLNFDKNEYGVSESWFDRLMNFRVPVKIVMVTVTVSLGVSGFYAWKNFQEIISFISFKPQSNIEVLRLEKEKESQKEEALALPIFSYKPVEISMKKMKTKGCVADGLLSGYGDDTDEAIKLINDSECQYLHRALETWAMPPDFGKASKIMERIDSDEIIYGMFIAEAIKTKAVYYYPEEERFFDFKKMCRESSNNAWGEHTCKPSFASGEYRKYLKYITRHAMDLGIQSFMFGQIYYQESSDASRLPEIIQDMKEYAEKKNMNIAIGAQTGDNTDKKYLSRFDFIEGGLGISENGEIENGPCWSGMESCWALLWHKKYADNAKNVFLHLDWSGLIYDDMSKFARMDSAKRAETLKKLYKYFTSRDMGFLMPIMATLHKDNGGCYGPSAGYYSASEKYSCKDEDVINLILKGK